MNKTEKLLRSMPDLGSTLNEIVYLNEENYANA